MYERIAGKVESIFINVFKGQKNFMTPEILCYGTASKTCVYEVSTGLGTNNTPIYGVTVARKKDGVWDSSHEESKLFHSRDEAFDYAKSLI